MKKLIISVIASLSLAVLPVYADPGRGRRGYEHHNDNDNTSLWAGIAVIGAIAGLALLAENNRPANVAPAPVYVEPPYPAPASYAPPQQPLDVMYYCQSSAMYYPHTRGCPEGWQMVQGSGY